MEKIVHTGSSRGQANFGWLNSKHTFSFGHYHNSERMSFGVLRVLNDDIVIGGAGFPTHPHSNMEIISIPLSGALAHRDSTGTEKVINTGEVQIMSAGSGLTHSEYNASKTEEVNFLQIWILPREENIKPRYDQKVFNSEERKNAVQTVVSPDEAKSLWINQNAWLSLSDLDAEKSITYTLHGEGNGLYCFVIDGQIEVEGEVLRKRDAIGISDTDSAEVMAIADSKLLFIEVPMTYD
ncbi:MAG: pirin family protein [Ekhidna sp.]